MCPKDFMAAINSNFLIDSVAQFLNTPITTLCVNLPA